MERQKLRGGCSIPNVESVLDLLQRFGVWGLGGCDGCACAHFEILGIEVHVSCRKSEHCVRVHCGYLGFDQSELVPIAREVLSQLTFPSRYSLRFCDYSKDHKNGRRENGVWKDDQTCCYCNKPRADVDAYLCEECLRVRDANWWSPVDIYNERLGQLAEALIAEFVEADKLAELE